MMIKGNFPIDDFTKRSTPFYYYDLKLLKETLTRLKKIMSDNPSYIIHYAIKANYNPIILKTIASYGLGADCVSGGEIKAALSAGFNPGTIVFSGVGKSDSEIEYALANRIDRLNVESLAELEVISDIARNNNTSAPVSIRVNPNIGPHTNSKITTGLAENKFGISYEKLESVIEKALSLENVEFKGLHFHIGSQIIDMSDFAELARKINLLSEQLKKCNLPTGDINVGGGLGINYEHPNHMPFADFDNYFNTFKDNLLIKGPVHFELGRSIVAPCGSIISRIMYVKEGDSRQFAIIDAGMTELIRPALYGAYHRIENLTSDLDEELYDVVGPICESTDVFIKGAPLNKCRRGDLISIRSTGAYSESMQSHYNCRDTGETYYRE